MSRGLFDRSVASTLLAVMLLCMFPLPIMGQSSAPYIKVIAPEKDSTVLAGEPLSVLVVTSIEEIVNLAIMCDDKAIALMDKSPYSTQLETTNLSAGSHSLWIRAYVKDGKTYKSLPVSFSVLAKQQEPAPTVSSPAPVAATPPIQAEPAKILLKERTPILLKTTKDLVSGKTPKGAMVDYMVARDVLGPDRKVLIEYGAHAYGKVTDSRRRGMFGKNGKIEFTVENVTAVDGTNVPLRGGEESSGKNNTGTMVVSILLLTVLAVFVHGRDVTIPEGSEVAAYIDRDTFINTNVVRTGEILGVPVETIEVKLPKGSRVNSGEPLQVDVVPSPADKAFIVRALIDGKEVIKKEKDFRTLQLDTKGLSKGKHQLQAEVTFASGLTLRQSVEFEIIQ